MRLGDAASIDLDAAGPSIRSTLLPGRQRRDTVTRGNFRGLAVGGVAGSAPDEDMDGRSEREEDISLGEGDVEMA
jgi:hypothetical protein